MNRLRKLYQYWRVAVMFRGAGNLGNNLNCLGPVVLLGREHISIGDRFNIAGFLHIMGHGGVAIGNDVLNA